MKRILIFSGIGILVLALILAGLAAAGTAPQNTTSVSGEPVAGDTHPDTPDGAGNVAAGNNRFAFDLYRQLATDPAYAGGNLFFSPYSISSALAITYEGARGTTADEIGAVLHLPANDTLRREGFAALNAALNRGSGNYTLRTANALWAEETYSFLPDYIDVAARWYGANVTNLDFIENPEGSRETINRWVEERTEDRIRDLLPPNSIDPLTRLVITNAIYFKGTWVEEFDANETREEEFRVGPGKTVTRPDDAADRRGCRLSVRRDRDPPGARDAVCPRERERPCDARPSAEGRQPDGCGGGPGRGEACRPAGVPDRAERQDLLPEVHA